MASRWEYQKLEQMYYKHQWCKDHRKHLTEYQARYRAEHPEETKIQNRQDVARFKERHPERWKEINQAARRRYQARQQALREAQKEGR